MDRILCVSESISDDHIRRAWNHLFGNNAIDRIECRDSKKMIYLDSYYLEHMEEDDMAELLDMYHEIEDQGKILFYLHDPSIEWWMYGMIDENKENYLHFEVCFA